MAAPEPAQLTLADISKDLPLHVAVLTEPPEMSVQLIHKAMSANPKVPKSAASFTLLYP